MLKQLLKLNFIILLFLPLVNIVSQSVSDALTEDYFPLNLGNQWQYIKHVTDGGNVETYSLRYASIAADTLIVNQLYYYYTSDWLYDTDWIFYSDSTQSIYVFWEDTNRVFMDFTLPVGSTFQQFVIGRHLYYEAEIVEDNFGIGYYRFQPIASRHFQEIYTNNLGPIRYREWSYQGFNIFIEYELIQAKLTTVNGDTLLYSNHFKPIFSINPILTINSLDFDFEFYIGHEYSKFFPPGYPGDGLNFIDSVWMYRYYSNGDSIINIFDFLPYNDSLHANPKYSVNFQIDTTLMKNGFNFYYKFLAKDKGIIPEYTWSPDSGYYECVWDFAVAVSEADNNLTYSLGQNFPNPFNPTTKIKFTISDFGFTILKVYDTLGREVATLVNEELSPGEYDVQFGGRNLPSGIYFYQLSAGSFIETKKMILIK